MYDLIFISRQQSRQPLTVTPSPKTLSIWLGAHADSFDEAAAPCADRRD